MGVAERKVEREASGMADVYPPRRSIAVFQAVEVSYLEILRKFSGIFF